MHLFSIVIANYNHGEFLETAILSVINQSYKDFELIVVDGESTDKSTDIIKKYENKLSWWVSEKDSGQSQAFNKGFTHAKGEYYFWLNADDILLPDSLVKAKGYIDKYPNSKWFAANTIFFGKDKLIQRCAWGPSGYISMMKNTDINVYGPSSIFHKSLFEEVGGFDENLKYTMDTDLWMRFARHGYKLKRIKSYFWGFRIHEKSKTSHAYNLKPNDEFRKEQEFIRTKNDFKFSKISNAVKQVLKLIDGSYIKSYIDSNRYKGENIFNYE